MTKPYSPEQLAAFKLVRPAAFGSYLDEMSRADEE